MGTLRFLLAVAVVFVHTSPVFGVTLIPGYLAVQSFYIISGFLMAMVFAQKYSKTERPYYFFITNRILRLYPLYITIIICTILLSVGFGMILHSYGKLQFYADQYHSSPQSFGALLTVFISNFLLAGQDIISFFSINKETGKFYFIGLQKSLELQDLLLIPIGWTVAVEFIFYLFAPLVSTKKIYNVLVWIGAILFLRFLLYYSGQATEGFSIYRFAPTEFFWFLLGMLAYSLKMKNFALGQKAGIYCLTILIVFIFAYEHIHFEYKDFIFFVLVFISCTPLFLSFGNNKYDKYLGDLCYPIYLSHCLILLVVDANRFPKPFGKGLPTLVMTIIFSIMVNKFLLIPLEKYRQKRIIKARELAAN